MSARVACKQPCRGSPETWQELRGVTSLHHGKSNHISLLLHGCSQTQHEAGGALPQLAPVQVTKLLRVTNPLQPTHSTRPGLPETLQTGCYSGQGLAEQGRQSQHSKSVTAREQKAPDPASASAKPS